ncbi:MAG: DNA polymerase III subunit beta [Simkaniaceae bacterium]|nr:DNA polymerase III subunit beta [Simkaniaceae bacterium]MCF7852900.1 DNA polymerase III subunit beta [Simkaniaceae bacterium]
MKLVISRSELVSLIGKIQNVVPSKPAIPILSNILIEAQDGQLIMSATDLTVSMKAYTDAKILKEGSIALPARRFFQLTRELTSPQIKLECDAHGIATIISGTSEFKLNGMNKSEFPSLPDLAAATTFSIQSDLLKDMLYRTSFAAARDDSRQVLNGIYTEIQDNTLTFVGTDGKRLAKIHESIDFPSSKKLHFIMPLKAVEEMTRILDGSEQAKFSIMSDKIALEVGSICLITKLLSGQYPDVDRVIPTQASMKSITLHKEELTTLLKQVSLFTSEMNYSVRFSFQDGQLRMQAVSNDIGEGKVNMPVDYHEDRLDIAFNPYFFIDILKHCKDETTTFGLTDSYNPGMITDSSSAQYVIMPMRLTNE